MKRWRRQRRIALSATAVALLIVAVGGIFFGGPLWLRLEVRWCLAGLLDDDASVRLQSYRRLAEELKPEVIPLLSAAHPSASPELKPLIVAILRDRLAITLEHPGKMLFGAFHPG